MLNIELKPEYILSIHNLPLTNTFVTSVLVTIIISFFGLFFYINKNNHKNIIINGIRTIITELLKTTDMVTEDRKMSKKVLPLIATFFLFITSANLLALIPGFLGSLFVNTPTNKLPLLRSPNSDLTTTVALALFSVFSIQFFSIQKLGVKKYIRRFINLSNPIQFILGLFELLSEMVKILSFSFRLFGNIFAGEVLLLVTAFLIPYIIPLPFMILEVFVGIIQAFIFSILTLTFIRTSTINKVEKI